MFRTTGYDRTLNQIRGLTIELGRATNTQVDAAIETLVTPDDRTDWRAQDRHLDEQRDFIVNRCYDLMSLQQLRDRDLRWILGYQRIAQEFERIGDYACDIAEFSALQTAGAWPEVLHEMGRHLSRMAEYTVRLLDDALVEPIDLDQEDDFLDERYNALRKGMGEAGKQKDLVWGLVLIQARTIERMGDHIVNIAKALKFIEREV